MCQGQETQTGPSLATVIPRGRNEPPLWNQEILERGTTAAVQYSTVEGTVYSNQLLLCALYCTVYRIPSVGYVMMV